MIASGIILFLLSSSILGTLILEPPTKSNCSRLSEASLVTDGSDGDSALSDKELDNARELSDQEISECYGVKPASLGDSSLLLGDMKMPQSDKLHSVISVPDRLWPGGVVPYVLSGAYSSTARSAIANAMQELHRTTCLRFRPRVGADASYLRIFPSGKGCWSYMGRIGWAVQDVSLDAGCLVNGIILHELLHAVGFIHEHSRPDRDSWVSIQWQNIPESVRSNFARYGWDVVKNMGIGYDYASVMHYGARAGAKAPGLVTIKGLRPGWQVMGSRNHLSSKDIQKVRKLYNCQGAVMNCRDKNSNCPGYKYYCHYDVIKNLCPLTCNICDRLG